MIHWTSDYCTIWTNRRESGTSVWPCGSEEIRNARKKTTDFWPPLFVECPGNDSGYATEFWTVFAVIWNENWMWISNMIYLGICFEHFAIVIWI
jgi:hypothetical protein